MNHLGKIIATSKNGIHEITALGNRVEIDVDEPLPVTNETIFDLASITKILATTNLMMNLVDQKIVNVTDLVCRYLPGWNSSEKSEIRIHHLLSHRSGLPPWRPLYINHMDKPEAFSAIEKLALETPIDSVRKYSDLGFMVLGQIIETLFQEGLELAFESKLKEILNLDRTSFAIPLEMANVAGSSLGDIHEFNMVASGNPYPVSEKVNDFDRWRKHVLVGEVNDGNAFHTFNGVSGHAGLFSTAKDILKVCEIYLQSYKDDSFFKSNTIKNFTEPGRDPLQGLGFRNWKILVDGREHLVFGHTGFTGVSFGFIPEIEFGLVMLTNRLHTYGEPIKTEELWLSCLKDSLSRIVP